MRMSSRRQRPLLRGAWIAALSTLSFSAAGAERPPSRAERPMALGVQLDLFPTVVSAVNGKEGYAPQLWLGIAPIRLRLVGAHLEPPDAFAFADEGFVHPTTTVFATIIDY